MDIRIWNTLHDGEIVSIKGTIPGDIELTIEIEYLRKMFSGEGKNVVLTLKGCKFFEYKSYEMKENSSGLDSFLEDHPIVLSTADEIKDGKIEIYYTNGSFFLKYLDFSLKLDNDKEISYNELDNAAEKYWDNWEKESKEARNKK
jgi:hypothetical protein